MGIVCLPCLRGKGFVVGRRGRGERRRLSRNTQRDVGRSDGRGSLERHRRSLVTVSATEAPLSRVGRNDPVGFL